MKDCLIIGPASAFHYEEVYNLLKDNVLRLGHKGYLQELAFWFIGEDGKKHRIASTVFTTLQVRNRERHFTPTKTYDKDKYPKYENRVIHPNYIYKFPVHQVIIWDKLSTPNLSKFYFYPVTEYIFWLSKGTPYVNKTDCDFKTSVWRIPSEKRSQHPAPFPIELPRNLIRACSKEGDVVYDPFMGSGTTARAAMEENRHFLGSEISRKYVNEFNGDVTSLLHNADKRSISI